jgi:signal transduction histidine kinase
MTRMLGRLLPRTLSTRLIVMAALSLLAAQAISFVLLMNANHRQMVAMAVAPAVLRVMDFNDMGAPSLPDDHGQRGGRIRVSTMPPAIRGRAAPDLAARAREMLVNGGIKPMQVIAFIDRGPMGPHNDRFARITGADFDPHRDRTRLHLAVQLAPDRWVVTVTSAPRGAAEFIHKLIMQTLLIYALVLVPLLWFGHRLSAPLSALANAARNFSPDQPSHALADQGTPDIRDLTRAFNDMWARIAAMLAEKDHMLGAIGHDLRTPLASLRIRVESVADDEERDQLVATIDEMHQMLEDILALARVGRERAPPQIVDLAALVEAVVDDFETTGAPVSIETCERAVASIHMPAMRRALRNLIDNAVKYGERATVSVRAAGGQAIIMVEDEGPGIDPDRMGEMLQPFTRLEKSRNRESGGAGLGLALVQAVMRSESGKVELINRQDGRGLSARLILPLARS